MHYSIKQLTATRWALVAEDGTIVGEFDDAPAANGLPARTGYALALASLGGIITTELAEAAPLAVPGQEQGLLPEGWQSDEGIAFSVATPGGRDFSSCEWSWRDPGTSLLPVMFQTKNLPAHMEAELAGFITELSGGGVGKVGARGRFYDSEMGRQALATLKAGGRFGVSVDPTEKVDYTDNIDCIVTDEETGECLEYELTTVFNAYEIGGFTMEPHPCFENASIVPESAAVEQPVVAPIAASAKPSAPPVQWMRLSEPKLGQPWLMDNTMGDDVLVPQYGGDEIVAYAVPLTIVCDLAPGERTTGTEPVYGHLTYWGECHVAEPWGAGVCAAASPSKAGYRDFLTGHVVCDDGTDVPTGVLTVGCEHSAAFDCAGVRDHLAHAGMGWADVTITDGTYGPWLSGVLKPDLTAEQVRLLRSLSLSGEWVGELGGILAVNTPGLPIQRALAASALPPSMTVAKPALRASARNGEMIKLVGGHIVRRCPECEKRRMLGQAFDARDDLNVSLLRKVARDVERLERRTRHLIPTEAAAARARLTLTAQQARRDP